MKLISLTIFAALFLAGCAHHRDVRPGADGIHSVRTREPNKERAERSAISQAEHYCESMGDKHPAFFNENTKYTGTMDEGTRDTVNKASKAAMILGGAAGTMGRSSSTRGAGTVVGAAGTAGHVMTSGDDYEAEMKFKCQ